jgi:2-phosphosulfolactate phosphatase
MNSQRAIHVAFLPSIAREDQIRDHAIVVIDILRATTTIVTALYHGASEIIPCAEIDQARRIAGESDPRGLLGGERQGLRIPGFDLGNSPSEYSRAAIGGRRIVLATTNGTPAMEVCRPAKVVWIAAFSNLSAAVQKISNEPNLTLICAGTDGRVTGEDVLFAGYMIERMNADSGQTTYNDQAEIARGAWRDACRRIEKGEKLSAILGLTHGGRNLIRNGLQADVEMCAEIDRVDTVPQLDVGRWSIRIP